MGVQIAVALKEVDDFQSVFDIAEKDDITFVSDTANIRQKLRPRAPQITRFGSQLRTAHAKLANKIICETDATAFTGDVAKDVQKI